MSWHNQDSQVIEELPMDVFQDKSFELIYLEIPITSIHPKALESSKNTLKFLGLRGSADRPMPITKFPFGMLGDFPNFEELSFHYTSISDETFMDEDNSFSDVEIPNLRKIIYLSFQLLLRLYWA